MSMEVYSWQKNWELLGRDVQTRATHLFVKRNREHACEMLAKWRKARKRFLLEKPLDELVILWRLEAPRRLSEKGWRNFMSGLAEGLLKKWGLPALKDWRPQAGKEENSRRWPRSLDKSLESLPHTREQIQTLLELCCELAGARPKVLQRWLEKQPEVGPIRMPIQLRRDDSEELPEPLTLLDRLLYREVRRTQGKEQGSLSPERLEALLKEVRRLNTERHATHFHQGFMDVCWNPKCQETDLPGFNDACREWRLAGMLAAHAHARNDLGPLLEKCFQTFARASSNEAGRVIAFFCFERFLENKNFLGQAQSLLRGQLEQFPLPGASLWLVPKTLDWVRGRVRQGDAKDARLLLEPLVKLEEQLLRKVEDDTQIMGLSREIRHLQARVELFQGSFQSARELLEQLKKEPGVPTKVFSDLGLACSQLKSIEALKIAPEADQRECLLKALEKGETHFREAVAREGRGVTIAHQALAMLAYLRYWKVAPKETKQALLNEGLRHAQEASNAMRTSDGANYYQETGCLSQSLFIQSVLGMESLDEAEFNAAYECWMNIQPQAGDFPSEHVEKFLEAATLINSYRAADIAKSIWGYWGGEAAWKILSNTARDFLRHSERLQKDYLRALRDNEGKARIAHGDRWRAARDLLPTLLEGSQRKAKSGDRKKNLELAVEVLDIMQVLAEGQDDCKRSFIELLEKPDNYAPAWEELEASWAQVGLLRALGADRKCGELLRNLFYKFRDEDPEQALDILRAMEGWQYGDASEGLREALPSPDPVDPVQKEDEEKRLREGEEVRLLFIGGDERQAPYDASIQKKLGKRWPGVQVTFQHPGWSSNWGRKKNQFIKECNAVDAVVLMSMMRTHLGRTLRRALAVPWVSCTYTGRAGILGSLERAALKALRCRAQLGNTADSPKPGAAGNRS